MHQGGGRRGQGDADAGAASDDAAECAGSACPARTDRLGRGGLHAGRGRRRDRSGRAARTAFSHQAQGPSGARASSSDTCPGPESAGCPPVLRVHRSRNPPTAAGVIQAGRTTPRHVGSEGLADLAPHPRRQRPGDADACGGEQGINLLLTAAWVSPQLGRHHRTEHDGAYGVRSIQDEACPPGARVAHSTPGVRITDAAPLLRAPQRA